ncbi:MULTISPECIES: hypothetical protein [Paenibacillus]|uniref:hypothetical protein n=1 Tax=Paenibacillus TaxID=44249 RepID=UPI000CDAD412|nr:hypothetical protein [Paenibacillus polymyxa]POR28630.1 hypothetical protein CG775_08675 [Paenibacillus polymyxa]
MFKPAIFRRSDKFLSDIFFYGQMNLLKSALALTQDFSITLPICSNFTAFGLERTGVFVGANPLDDQTNNSVLETVEGRIWINWVSGWRI